jgi:hypothetical protein
MHSLIITVKSLRLIATGFLTLALQSLFQQYCNLVGSGLFDNKYSIPSLIWPPPRITYSQRLAEMGVNI